MGAIPVGFTLALFLMLEILNPGLERHPELDALARIRCQEVQTDWSHTGFYPLIRRYYLHRWYRAAYEVLAMNGGYRWPHIQALRQWLGSTAGHREIVRNQDNDRVGLASCRDEGLWYFVVIFTDLD